MTLLLPLIIIFTILQLAAYWYVGKHHFFKGSRRILFGIISVYILIVLVLPVTSDGEYISSGVVAYIKIGIILIGTAFSIFVHFVVKKFKH